MKIKMLASIRGSLNGVTVDDLKEGEIYSTAATAIGERMGKAHVANCAAIEVDEAGEPVIKYEPAPEEDPAALEVAPKKAAKK